MSHGAEAEDLLSVAATDGAKSSSEEAGDDGGTDLEDVTDELVARCNNQLQPADDATQHKAEGKVDGSSIEGEGCNGRGSKAVDRHSWPATELVLTSHDGFETGRSLIDTNAIVDDFLVDLVDIA